MDVVHCGEPSKLFGSFDLCSFILTKQTIDKINGCLMKFRECYNRVYRRLLGVGKDTAARVSFICHIYYILVFIFQIKEFSFYESTRPWRIVFEGKQNENIILRVGRRQWRVADNGVFFYTDGDIVWVLKCSCRLPNYLWVLIRSSPSALQTKASKKWRIFSGIIDNNIKAYCSEAEIAFFFYRPLTIFYRNHKI